MPNIVYCDFCKESFDIKKLTAHRNKCRKNPNTNIECKYCRKEFNQSEIHSHLIKCKKYHENKSKNNIFIICEHCNERILRKNLLFHNSLCFKNPKNWKNIEDYKEDKSPEIFKNELFSGKNKSVVKYTGDNAYLANDDGSVEFLGKQDKSKAKPKKDYILKNIDSYYNSKSEDNTAFSKRDNGKFGSMPLHDNYDEESNA